MQMGQGLHPSVFLSYSWDGDAHSAWVAELAGRLRADGVNAAIDKWHLAPGDRLSFFMEQIENFDFTLVICTPGYKTRSDNRTGGVGYEGDIITSELFLKGNHRKFIPLLRGESWEASAPVWARGKVYLDFRGDPYQESAYGELLDALYGTQEGAPALGEAPQRRDPGRRLDLMRDLTPLDKR